MIRDFFKLFEHFLKSTLAPKMFSRFLMIGTREFTDRQIDEERKKIVYKYRPHHTPQDMLRAYVAFVNR